MIDRSISRLRLRAMSVDFCDNHAILLQVFVCVCVVMAMQFSCSFVFVVWSFLYFVWVIVVWGTWWLHW